MNTGSQAPTPGDSAQPHPEDEAGLRSPRLELPDAADELLAMVRYVTADDGPLRATLDPGELSPWHERELLKALERLEVIDHFLRGRVAFFVAGKDHGYGPFEGQLEVAGVALDTCRATARVVDALLAGRLPTEPEHDAMTATSERLYAALKAFEDDEI
jgi:hypothetical protein